MASKKLKQMAEKASSVQRFNYGQYKRIDKAHAKGEIEHDRSHFKSISRHSRKEN